MGSGSDFSGGILLLYYILSRGSKRRGGIHGTERLARREVALSCGMKTKQATVVTENT